MTIREKIPVIGVTGKSGSGKTTICNILEEMNVYHINCDALYHELLDTNISLQNDLAHIFPECATKNDKGYYIDRKILGDIVFNDPNKLETLNKVTEPYICHKVKEVLRRLTKNVFYTGACIDGYGLIGSSMAGLCKKIFIVQCLDATKAARIEKRDGITREIAWKRIDSQDDDITDFDREDCIFIRNSGSIESLREVCEDIILPILNPQKAAWDKRARERKAKDSETYLKNLKEN